VFTYEVIAKVLAVDNPQENRRAALRAWLKARGGAAAVIKARNLNASAMSYLSQLTSSDYSFGEKAARNWERKLGMEAGHLDRQPTAAAEPAAGQQTLSPDEQQLLESYRDLLPEEQVEFARPILEHAERGRRYAAAALRKHGATGVASPAQVAHIAPAPPWDGKTERRHTEIPVSIERRSKLPTEVVARKAATHGKGRVRGASVLGELDELPSTVGTGKQGGRRS